MFKMKFKETLIKIGLFFILLFLVIPSFIYRAFQKHETVRAIIIWVIILIIAFGVPTLLNHLQSLVK